MPWDSIGRGTSAGSRSDDESRLVVVHVDFESGGTFTRNSCGSGGCKAYDTIHKQWRQPDSFGCRTFLQGLSPRVVCPSCGVSLAAVPWARSRQRQTLPFEAMVVELAREMPIRAVSRLVGEHDTRMRRIVNHCGSGRS